MSERRGVTPHQHAIILHEIANQIRATVATDQMDKHQLLAALDSMRAWMAQHAVQLLDDSRALAAERQARQAAEQQRDDALAALREFVEHHDNGQTGQPGYPRTYDETDVWQAEWDRRYEVLRAVIGQASAASAPPRGRASDAHEP